MASKNRLANDMFDEDFDDLSPGQKAAVTRAYNAQGAEREVAPRASASARRAGTVSATIGRIRVNGTRTCILNEGANLNDLLSQSGFELDRSKEGVMEKASGDTVKFTDAVEDGKTYVIAPGINSNSE